MRFKCIFRVSGIFYLAGATGFGYHKGVEHNLDAIVFKAESLPSDMTRAELHMWPCGRLLHLKGALIVAPGVNGDGREVLKNSGWFNFAKENSLLLVGVSFASAMSGIDELDSECILREMNCGRNLIITRIGHSENLMVVKK